MLTKPSRRSRSAGLLLLTVWLAACSQPAAAALPTPYPTTAAADRHVKTYDAFWETLQGSYLYQSSAGFDFEKLRSEKRLAAYADLSEAEFAGLMQSLTDPFPGDSVTYRSRAKRIEEDLANTISYEGIGAYVSVLKEPEPRIVLLAVVEKSPAQAAGLTAHDAILSVDGQPVLAAEGLDVIQRVRGPAGSVVSLDVRAPDGVRRTVEVTRGRLAAADQLRGGSLGASQVGFLRLPVGAGNELATALPAALQSMAGKYSNGLLLDLRVAHSADDWPLLEMLAIFGNGPMGKISGTSEQTPLTVTGQNVGGTQNVPLVLLVGAETQGASEIFAAALQASRRAVLIGQRTPGKVMRFNTRTLPDGSQMYYAIASYINAAGVDIGRSGVTPDIAVAEGWDQVNDKYDPVILRALQQISSDVPPG